MNRNTRATHRKHYWGLKSRRIAPVGFKDLHTHNVTSKPLQSHSGPAITPHSVLTEDDVVHVMKNNQSIKSFEGYQAHMKAEALRDILNNGEK